MYKTLPYSGLNHHELEFRINKDCLSARSLQGKTPLTSWEHPELVAVAKIGVVNTGLKVRIAWGRLGGFAHPFLRDDLFTVGSTVICKHPSKASEIAQRRAKTAKRSFLT